MINMIIICERVIVKVVLIKRILIITNKLIDKLIITIAGCIGSTVSPPLAI